MPCSQRVRTTWLVSREVWALQYKLIYMDDRVGPKVHLSRMKSSVFVAEMNSGEHHNFNADPQRNIVEHNCFTSRNKRYYGSSRFSSSSSGKIFLRTEQITHALAGPTYNAGAGITHAD